MTTDVFAYNREAWDGQVGKGNRWTVPVGPEEIAAAREGRWSVVLTPSKPVPRAWFPPDLDGVEVLCLASGGGQQAAILAAAGASVTVLDASPAQLAQDRRVAEREKLEITIVEGDMADLSCFRPDSFDLVFHPCSNCFVPDVRRVWRAVHRVLRQGGALLSGFCDPLKFSVDLALEKQGVAQLRYAIPYADLTSLTEEERARWLDPGDPLAFGHTLEDQIGGQTDTGFFIAGFYDDRGDESDVVSKYVPAFHATRALRP